MCEEFKVNKRFQMISFQEVRYWAIFLLQSYFIGNIIYVRSANRIAFWLAIKVLQSYKGIMLIKRDYIRYEIVRTHLKGYWPQLHDNFVCYYYYCKTFLRFIWQFVTYIHMWSKGVYTQDKHHQKNLLSIQVAKL